MTLEQRDKLSDIHTRMEYLRAVLELFTDPFIRITDPSKLSIEAFSRAETWNILSCLLSSMTHELLETFNATLDDIDTKGDAA